MWYHSSRTSSFSLIVSTKELLVLVKFDDRIETPRSQHKFLLFRCLRIYRSSTYGLISESMTRGIFIVLFCPQHGLHHIAVLKARRRAPLVDGDACWLVYMVEKSSSLDINISSLQSD